MKILFLSATGAIGGAENVLLLALASLRRLAPDAQLHLLALSSGPLIERAQALGVDAAVLPLPHQLHSLGDSQLHGMKNRMLWLLKLLARSLPLGWGTWRWLRQLRKRVSEISPDVIHSNGIKTHALLWLAGADRIPVLWHVHDFLSKRPLARKFLRRPAARIAGAIAISQAVADDVRQLWPNLKVEVIPNAVDVLKFSPGPADDTLLDRLAGLPPRSCCRVGLVATYARWKGHTVFLHAAARLLRDRPDFPVRFYIIGGPIYQTQGSQFDRAELQALARQLGIAAEVGFIDFQRDVVPIYRTLDVVVHASTSAEPFGLTIIEAMACGRAVIVSQAGGAAEIVQSGHDALSVPPGDEAVLAGALSTLVDDVPRRITLGNNARKKICERYDQDRFGAQLMALFAHFSPLPGILREKHSEYS